MKFASVMVATVLGGLLWFTGLWGLEAQAAVNHPYFLNELETDHTLLVSPNFDGDLSLEHLWQSLAELNQAYDIKSAKLIYSTWPHVRKVPHLLVYVAPQTTSSTAVVASRS